MAGMNEKKYSLALLDFDRTVTDRDSFVDFLLYNFGLTRLLGGFLSFSPAIILYLTKTIPNWKLKEVALTHFFGGWNLEEFSRKCQNYSTERLPKIIRPVALERIDWHKQNGHRVVIVSASISQWLKGWCDKNKLGLIASEIEVINNKVTGKLLGKNCYGIEKVSRIKKEYNLADFGSIFAYTDSKSDWPMLELADEKYYRWKKTG